jgi:hypothetical protein
MLRPPQPPDAAARTTTMMINNRTSVALSPDHLLYLLIASMALRFIISYILR